jgi:hypothetical protein
MIVDLGDQVEAQRILTPSSPAPGRPATTVRPAPPAMPPLTQKNAAMRKGSGFNSNLGLLGLPLRMSASIAIRLSHNKGLLVGWVPSCPS